MTWKWVCTPNIGNYFSHVYHPDRIEMQTWCVIRRRDNRKLYITPCESGDDNDTRDQGPFKNLKEAGLVAETLSKLAVD